MANLDKLFREEYYYTGNDENMVRVSEILQLLKLKDIKALSDWMKVSVDQDPKFINENNEQYLVRYKENDSIKDDNTLFDAMTINTNFDSIAKSVAKLELRLKTKEQADGQNTRLIMKKVDENSIEPLLKYTKEFNGHLNNRIERLHEKLNSSNKGFKLMEYLHEMIIENKRLEKENKELMLKKQERFDNPSLLIKEIADHYKVEHGVVLDDINEKFM